MHPTPKKLDSGGDMDKRSFKENGLLRHIESMSGNPVTYSDRFPTLQSTCEIVFTQVFPKTQNPHMTTKDKRPYLSELLPSGSHEEHSL
jgi:hypothetical protein